MTLNADAHMPLSRQIVVDGIDGKRETIDTVSKAAAYLTSARFNHLGQQVFWQIAVKSLVTANDSRNEDVIGLATNWTEFLCRRENVLRA